MQVMKNSEGKVRTPALVALVLALHVGVVGAVLFSQGCGTVKGRDQEVGQPPAPTLPPSPGAEKASAVSMPQPQLKPAATITEAPMNVEQAGGQTYKIQKGDSLSSVASRYGVSAREIAELNNIRDPNKIRINQTILLPAYARSEPLPKAVKKSAPTKATSAKSTASSAPVVAGEGEYIVKSGDSLSKIASRNGTTVKALREANNLKSDMIHVKQKLKLPGGKKAEAAAPAASEAPAIPAAPEASAAPSVPAIPAATGAEASVSAIPSPAAVAAPAAVPAAPAGSSEVPFEYTMKAGQTLDDVARDFAVLKSDILSLNGIADESTVKAGQKVKIPLGSP